MFGDGFRPFWLSLELLCCWYSGVLRDRGARIKIAEKNLANQGFVLRVRNGSFTFTCCKQTGIRVHMSLIVFA